MTIEELVNTPSKIIEERWINSLPGILFEGNAGDWRIRAIKLEFKEYSSGDYMVEAMKPIPGEEGFHIHTSGIRETAEAAINSCKNIIKVENDGGGPLDIGLRRECNCDWKL